MLWRILRAHGGTLPDDVVVCFANTGREMPATLDFVRDCGAAWNVPIHWLEYRRDATGAVSAIEVSHNSASRDGEPFEQAIIGRAMLPNPVTRYCTVELKIRTIRRWCVKHYGKFVTWTQVVGLRADEPKRVKRIMDPIRQKKAGAESRNVAVPLDTAGITQSDVLAFWREQPFDLRLKGKWEGNCDGCFLKRTTAIARMSLDYPERMAWWAKMEAERASLKARNPAVALFRMDRPKYAAIAQLEIDQARMDFDPDDDGMDAMFIGACDDGCGV